MRKTTSIDMRISLKFLYICLISILLLKLASIGTYELFDTTESRYAAIAMRMFQTGDYITPRYILNMPFLAKAPLSFWATAISFNMFGINEFAARLPHFIAFLANLAMVYMALLSFVKQKSLLITTIFASFGLSFIVMGGVMTESFLILGANMIILAFYKTCIEKSKSILWKYSFFLGIAIAMLAKGPAGAIISGLPIFFFVLIKNRWKDLLHLPLFTGTLLSCAIFLPWYIVCQKHNPDFLEYFIYGEHIQRFINPHWQGDRYGSPHHEPLFMIWAFLALSILPWVFYILYALIKSGKTKFWQGIQKNDTTFFFILAFLCPMIFFTFARNIIITYAAFVLMPLAFLLTLMLEKYSIKLKTIAIIMLSPAVLITAVFQINNYFHKFKDSHKYIVQSFESNKSIGSHLFYYHTICEFSAQFYSQDKLTILTSETDLNKTLASPNNFYVMNEETAKLIDIAKYNMDLKKIICAPINKNVCLYTNKPKVYT